MPNPKSPEKLKHADLAKIVRRIQEELYWDHDLGIWNPDKEWDSGTIEEVALHLDVYGLVPEDE